MLDAVIDQLNTPSTLKTIRIVVFQKPMLDDFHNSLKERAAPESKKKGWLESIGDRLKCKYTDRRSRLILPHVDVQF